MRVRRQRWLRGRGVTAASVLVLGVAGCGSSVHSRRAARVSSGASDAICNPAARAAIAHRLGVGAEMITERRSTGNNDEPQCTFGARRARFSVIVNVDSSPQPYARLERTVDEAAQIFSGQRLSPPPQNVSHLGLVAAWLPAASELLTTDTRRLITVTIISVGASQRRQLTVATVAARPYLGRFNPKTIQSGEV